MKDLLLRARIVVTTSLNMKISRRRLGNYVKKIAPKSVPYVQQDYSSFNQSILDLWRSRCRWRHSFLKLPCVVVLTLRKLVASSLKALTITYWSRGPSQCTLLHWAKERLSFAGTGRPYQGIFLLKNRYNVELIIQILVLYLSTWRVEILSKDDGCGNARKQWYDWWNDEK